MEKARKRKNQVVKMQYTIPKSCKEKILKLQEEAKECLKMQYKAAKKMDVGIFKELEKKYAIILRKIEGIRIKYSSSSSKREYAHEYHLPPQIRPYIIANSSNL